MSQVSWRDLHRLQDLFAALASTLAARLAPYRVRFEPALAFVQRRSRRELILLAVGVALLLAAVIVYVATGREDAAPDNEFVGLYCPSCDYYFERSARDFERRQNRHEYRSERNRLVFKCSKCSKLTAIPSRGRPVGTAPAAGSPNAPGHDQPR